MARREDGTVISFKDEERFLSNFWPAPIEATFLGQTRLWPTNENLYQAVKIISVDGLTEEARLELMEQFLSATPGEAKKMGAELKVNETWSDQLRVSLMAALSFKKFMSYKDLAEQLLECGEIYEGNNWGDKFFGVDLETLEGENHLGRILMSVAELLRLPELRDAFVTLNIDSIVREHSHGAEEQL